MKESVLSSLVSARYSPAVFRLYRQIYRHRIEMNNLAESQANISCIETCQKLTQIRAYEFIWGSKVLRSLNPLI
jgi:hypothetical protein